MANLTRNLTIALALILGRSAMALEPCTDVMASYYTAVERAVDVRSGPSAIVAITILPSFQPEYALRVLKDAVVLVRFQSSLWYEGPSSDGISPKKGFKVWTAPISSQLAATVAGVVARHIASAKRSDEMGLDGVSYRFSVPGAACASAWSPDETSTDGKLVELAQVLESHAQTKGKKGLATSEKGIVKALDKL